jgi:hypothetical protein
MIWHFNGYYIMNSIILKKQEKIILLQFTQQNGIMVH